eukprot:6740635-Heterocapsa_arctica.AAC.2
MSTCCTAPERGTCGGAAGPPRTEALPPQLRRRPSRPRRGWARDLHGHWTLPPVRWLHGVPKE